MVRLVLPILLLLIAGCDVFRGAAPAPAPGTDTAAPPADAVRPQVRPDVRAPKPGARTAEAFDTTTDAERKAAAEAPAASQRDLGITVASLGDPAEPGFWLKTPLVTAVGPGRVVYPVNGKSAQVELRPIDGPATAGSRISLAAMRLIEAPLTELPELQVYAE